MSQTRATATFAPNFAYSLLAKRAAAEKDVGKWDLSSLRLCGCGAEPVSADSLTRFTTALAGAKLRPTVMTPCYGMAEATLCMSAARLDQPLTVDSIDANTFRSGGRAVSQSGTAALTFVANGPAIPGHELRIVDESGRVLPERQVGEILFGGPSLGDGYEGRPEQTAAVFSHGFIHTGDLGYLAGGEIYITGRKKDLIIIRGRNYHPHAIEWAIEKVDGVRAGNVVAFSVPGEDSEELVIVCERRSAEEGDLAGAISRLVVEQFGLTPKQVLTFAAGTLPKTSSGKQQRQKTRALYLDGSLGRGGHRAASPTRDYLGLGAIWIRSLKARAKHKLSRRFQ